MFTKRIFVLFVTLSSLMITTSSYAQNDDLASPDLNECPSNFKHNRALNLCATKAFEKPAFKRAGSSQTCDTNYTQIGRSGLCVLDHKKLRLKFKDNKLLITKASKKKCGKNYIRLSNGNACVHKRLGLTLIDTKAKFIQTKGLVCDSRDPESASCKSKCAAGFFRSPELNICIDYNAAIQSNTLFSDGKCKNPKHWKKLENSGVCVPRVMLSMVSKPTGQLELQALESDLLTCEGDTEIQVTNLVFNYAEDSEDGQSNQIINDLASNIQPVMFCMVRPRPPK